MPARHRIDYIEMPASDLEATRQFFTELCDWQFTDYGPDYTAFADGRLNGGFFRSEQRFRIGEGMPLVVLYSDELETTLQRVEALGGKISEPIFEFPGGRRFHFLDPSGNEFAIWSE